MKLSTKGRYAVMAMTDLARRSNGKPMPLAEIAERQEISLSYLEQLFGKLRRNHLVTSTRGPGGGYMLARSLEETMVSDIVLAVDEPIKATRCTAGSSKGCHSDNSRCVTHDLWEELSNHIFLFLRSISLADVVERRILGRSGGGTVDGQLNRDANRRIPNQPAREVIAGASTTEGIGKVA
jgi:Rrf2 family iron-sulfur cluster assembly transcriptional regulator